MKHGDFSQLAENYARYRPAYAPSVLRTVMGLAARPAVQLRFADVGAGTGLWTRMLASTGASGFAVEPNDAMRAHGQEQSRGGAVEWRAGSGEATGLEAECVDLVSMASSFHWTEFSRSTAEFLRMLRPGGIFVALWNPRFIEANSLLVDIEEQLLQLVPTLKRVSSGRSDFTRLLTERLLKETVLRDVLYVEGRHVEQQTQERYFGLRKSVSHVQVQAGQQRFQQFIDYICARTSPTATIEATYLTRAWVAFK